MEMNITIPVRFEAHMSYFSDRKSRFLVAYVGGHVFERDTSGVFSRYSRVAPSRFAGTPSPGLLARVVKHAHLEQLGKLVSEIQCSEEELPGRPLGDDYEGEG